MLPAIASSEEPCYEQAAELHSKALAMNIPCYEHVCGWLKTLIPKPKTLQSPDGLCGVQDPQSYHFYRNMLGGGGLGG